MNEVKNTSSLGSLKFLTGPLAGKTYTITKPTINLGRDPASDVPISDPSVSRHHAEIALTGDGWIIKKVAAQNVLMLNKREVQQSPLLDRDTVALGPGTTFLFETAVKTEAPLKTELGQSVQQPAAPVPPTMPAQQSFSTPSVSQPQQPFQVSQSPQPTPNVQGWAEPKPAWGAYNPAKSGPSIPPTMSANAATPLPPVQTPPVSPTRSAFGSSGTPTSNTTTEPDFAGGAPFSQSQAPQQRPREATQRAFEPFTDGQTSRAGAQFAGVPSLEISTNTDREKKVHDLPFDKQAFDIGRDPSNDIVIDRPTVSGFHARIVREGNQLVLYHPNPVRGRGQTLNGITYQGQLIPGTQQFRHILARGDIFRISDENGTFVSLVYNDGSGQTQEALPEIRPIPLGAKSITLGRAPDNTVVLDHPQVSGHHARLEQERGGYRIIDTNSTNKVYINGKTATQHHLIPGDEIRIGPFRLTFTGTQLTQQDESNGIRIDALHLKKTGNKQAILIDDISIAVPSRKFVALVGGSGAGKSTLMDALNGLRPAQKGKVLYNGQDYYQHLAAFSTQLGYVPQDDIIHRDLTVERALYYAAKLRLPEDLTEQQIKERINDVLDDVDMKHRRHLLVSKLSGGQRKRVSIALELLANPSVFFLDEPTSGLDPGLDRRMMSLLRNLADKGHTIVLVTHATNNINACDYICFLCQGGRLAYFGPPDEAKAYFGKTDFAEIYSALEPTDENPNIPAEAEKKFRQSEDFKRYVDSPIQQGPAGKFDALAETAEVKPPKRGNPWKQFLLLSRRYIDLLLNDRVNLAILVLQAPIIAFILYFMTSAGTFGMNSVVGCDIPQQNGTFKIGSCQTIKDDLHDPVLGPRLRQIFRANPSDSIDKQNDDTLDHSIVPGSGGDAQKTLFIMAFAAVMFGGLNGSREIVKEAAIYRRERTVNLGIAPYIFSKFVVLGLFSLAQAFILVFFVNLAAPFSNPSGGSDLHGIIFNSLFLEIYISMALTSIAGLMTGLLISAVVPNNDRAMSLVPLPLIPQVIFAGVIFNLDPSLQIPAAFFPVRWAMAAMGSSIGIHNNKVNTDNFSNIGTLFPTAASNPNNLDPVVHLLISWGFLVALIVVQGALIAFFLKRKDVRK